MLNSLVAKSLACWPPCAPVCAGAAQAQVGTGRIGFVYTERLMTESKLAKAGRRKDPGRVLQAPEAGRRDGQALQGAREKFDEDAPKLNDIDRTRRTRELLDMEKDVQRMQREFNEDLIQRKNEERAAIAQRHQADRAGGRAGAPRRRAAGIGLDQPAHRHHRQDPQAARQISNIQSYAGRKRPAGVHYSRYSFSRNDRWALDWVNWSNASADS
jgi:outer membrane protein